MTASRIVRTGTSVALLVAACFVVVSPARAGQIPRFQAPHHTVSPYGVPGAMAVVDLDGAPSLLMSSFDNTSRLHVRRGVLGPDEAYVVSDVARSIAAGRVDADVHTDVVLAGGDNLIVLLANPDGTLSAPVSYPVSKPMEVAMANVMGDARQELAVLRTTANALEVRVPDAVGILGPPATFATGPGAHSMVVADVNDDGMDDLVVANKGDSTVSVFLGDAAGFGTRLDTPLLRSPKFVRVADVDHDEVLDLIVAASGAPALVVLAGNGDGTFGTPVESALPYEPESIAVGDTDADGSADVIIAPAGDGLALLPGHGTLDYPDARLYPNWNVSGDDGQFYWPPALAARDLDGDGRTEVVVSCWNFDPLDFNNASYLSYVAVINPLPDGQFQQPTEIPTGPAPGALAAGDLNGDGHPDLAVTKNGFMTLLLATGPGRFDRTDVDLGGGQSWVVIADLDHVDPLDVIAPLQGLDKLAVLLGRNGDLPERMPDVPTGDGPSCVAILDANGDGHNDVAVAASYAHAIEVHLGNGDGTFGPAITTPVDAYFNSGLFVAAGYFDSDTNADLLVAERGFYDGGSFSVVEVWLGDGDGTFTPDASAYVYSSWYVGWASFARLGSVTSAVYAQPNRQDSFFHYDAEGLEVLWGDGSGGSPGGLHVPGGLAPLSGAVGDLDGDGYDEVVVSNDLSNSVSVYSSSAGPFGDTPGLADQLELGTGPNPRGIAIADVNWDGLPDILVANGGSNSISILYNLETGLDVEPAAPDARPLTLLDRARPNPTRGGVSITLTLPRADRTRVRVYDGAGRLVRTLIDAELPAGQRTLRWDGRSGEGAAVAPGVYYFDACAGAERATRRVVLLR